MLGGGWVSRGISQEEFPLGPHPDMGANKGAGENGGKNLGYAGEGGGRTVPWVAKWDHATRNGYYPGKTQIRGMDNEEKGQPRDTPRHGKKLGRAVFRPAGKRLGP